ncbi:MAG: hypothetical protein IPL99_04600 [Candidatus Competibacteraceae bacterium]|nr:hypothetical protein [Candidatus Competibacteraceae bacterium]
MNKTIATTLLILASGLTLSTTALAEPFQHGSGYINAISNEYSNADTQGMPHAQSVRRTETMATTSGFNDRSTVENEGTTVSRRVVESPLSRMLSLIAHGFNDRS